MNDIVTFEELQNLSGFKLQSKVITWLRKNHIPFLLARNNRPIVNKEALAHKMGAPSVIYKSNETEPNFEAL